MAWPFTRRTTYVNGTVPAINADDLNAMQDRIADLGLLPFLWGSSFDGVADMNGTNTFSWATLSGSTYTLNRDVQCAQLTVETGITLVTNGYRLYVAGLLWNKTGAHIHNDGGAGANGTLTGATHGVGAPAGSLLGGDNGGAGGGHTSGAPGNGVGHNFPLNGSGGIGGAGGVGTVGSPGTGGSITALPATMGVFGSLDSLMSGFVTGILSGTTTVTSIVGGCGGGGGGAGDDGIGNGSNGGAGGGGAGVLLIWAQFVQNDGVISVNGGRGGDATTAAGSGFEGGGGGGGSGGRGFIGCGTYSGTGTTTATGGAHGTPQSGGGTGANGTVGFFTVLQLAA